MLPAIPLFVGLLGLGAGGGTFAMLWKTGEGAEDGARTLAALLGSAAAFYIVVRAVRK